MTFPGDARIPSQPYPALRHVLQAFVDALAAQLKDNLVGIYLVGSLASGDFDADSDVDFLAVIHADLPAADMQALQAIQARIFAMDGYPAKHLEGSWITLADLNDPGAVGKKPLFYFDNGSVTPEFSTHDNQWHVRWILRERGVTLAGPDPKTLLPPVPLAEMYAEVKATMRLIEELFQDAIDAPLGFFNSRFGQSFAVLTICRMLHTLNTGAVQSKQAGMEWARQFVDPQWVRLIDEAWKERQGVRFGAKIRQRAEPARLQETLEFIHYAVAQHSPPLLPQKTGS